MTNKYEIDVDLGDEAEDLSSAMDAEDFDSAGRLKSAVTKKKGRGFSSADGGHGLEAVTQFDVLAENNVGNAQKSVEGWAVFVTGVHEECTEEDLYDKFADFGPVKDLKMPLDHRTGYVKGYAIVEYASHQEAKAAIENMDGQKVMEQEIRCDFVFVRGHTHVSGGDEGGSSRRYREGSREVIRRGEDSHREGRDARDVVQRGADGSGRRMRVYDEV